MNPNEVSDQPGQGFNGHGHGVSGSRRRGDRERAGLVTVAINPAAQQRMGLTFGKVEKRSLASEIRTAAIIVPDETRLYRVSVKFEGWVDKLFIAVTGQGKERRSVADRLQPRVRFLARDSRSPPGTKLL